MTRRRAINKITGKMSPKKGTKEFLLGSVFEASNPKILKISTIMLIITIVTLNNRLTDFRPIPDTINLLN